jgi:Ni/Fe-hydrogenase 1 B-type cytochrome subunit
MRTRGLRADHVEIEIGEAVPYGGADPGDVLRYAAAGGMPGSRDRLEEALVADAVRRGLPLPAATVEGPAVQEGGVAVTTLREEDGGRLRIARGEPRTLVRSLVRLGGPARLRAAAGAARLAAGGYRPLAVAVRHGDGEWRLLGQVPVRAWTRREGRRGRPFDYHAVWDHWLRLAHWTWVGAIVVLTVTGYVISDPGWVPTAWVDGNRAGYFMGYVRFVHLSAAVVFMLVLLLRAWNLSTSRIPYDRWKALVPFRNRRELRAMFRTVRAYLFIRAEEAPAYFGHNPLQQLTYTVMYLVFLVQAMSGLALWGLYDARHGWWGWFQWLNVVLGTQQVRLLHLMVMWLILLFLPAHVYLSIRADNVERSGAISSMVSGGRWIRRGAVFEDWPPR